MKVVFLCYLHEYRENEWSYCWDEWMTQEGYECPFHPGNPQEAKEPGIERDDDGLIEYFDIIAEISDEWKDGIIEGREDEYGDETQEALWKGVRAVFPPDRLGVKITQETLEDYAKRFPQIYADAFAQEVEA